MKVATGIYITSTSTIQIDIDSVAEDKRLCIDEVYELIKTIPEWMCKCGQWQRGGITCIICDKPRSADPSYNIRDAFVWQICERLATELLLDACDGRGQNINDSIKTLIETPCDHLAEVLRDIFELAKYIRAGIKTTDELVAEAKRRFAPIGKQLAAVFDIKIPSITVFDNEPELEYNDFILRKSSGQTSITNGVTVVASIITCSIATLSNRVGNTRCLDLSGIGVCMPVMNPPLKIDQNVFQITNCILIYPSFADLIYIIRNRPEFIQQKDTLRYKPATAAEQIQPSRFAQPPQLQKNENSCILM